MVNGWFLELTRASIGDCRVLCFLGNLGLLEYYFHFEERAELSERDEESACGRRLGRLPVGKEPWTPPAESAAKKCQCVRNHRPHKRKNCVTRAKAGGEVSLYFGITRSEREPHGTCQRAGNIIGAVDTARRGALVRQVSPAEEPTESAAKKRQCERSHWSKDRRVAELQLRKVGLKWSRRLHDPSLKNSWGMHRQG